jgi:hypothetical protein
MSYEITDHRLDNDPVYKARIQLGAIEEMAGRMLAGETFTKKTARSPLAQRYSLIMAEYNEHREYEDIMQRLANNRFDMGAVDGLRRIMKEACMEDAARFYGEDLVELREIIEDA